MQSAGRIKIKLKPSFRWFAYLVWLIVAISGICFAVWQDWFVYDPNDWTLITLKIHGLSAVVCVLIIGMLLSTHVRLALARKRNVWTGVLVLAGLFVLGASGYGLYYAPFEWHEFVKWTHIISGVIMTLILPIHIIVGRFRTKVPQNNSGLNQPND